MSDLDIVIVNFNTAELILSCLKSIYDADCKINYRIFVVDNASSDDSVKKIKNNFPKVNLIVSNKNLGFSGGNNLGLQKTSAESVLLLNSDTEIYDGSLDGLLRFVSQSEFGIASCKILNREGKLQPNAGDLPFGFPLLIWLGGLDDILFGISSNLPSFHRHFDNYYKGDREVGWVSGSVMVISRKVIKKIGLLDDKIFMYAEDTEYCLRAKKAGFKIGWTDKAQIKHLGGGSSSEPALKQWVGEFKGLLYIYKKYYGFMGQLFLKILIYFFTLLRVVAFFLIGRFKQSRTYVQVIESL